MTRANRFLKIFNIADGVTRQFYNDELENVEIIERITDNNQALNINEASLKILPLINSGVLFQRTLPFTIYRNDELFGRFYIDKSIANTDQTIYDITVSDYIKILEAQTYLGGLYTNKTVSSLIAEILGDIPYTLDATLGAYTVSGYLPILTKREALRQVAFCLNAFIDTSRTDKIEIKPFLNARNRFVDKSEIFYIETTQENITTKIELNTQQLTTKNAENDDLFEGILNGTKMIVFDSPKFNLSISGTGGTIISSNINYAIISGTGSNIKLTGKSYEQYVIVATKTNDYTVSSDIEKIDSYDTTLTCDNINILDYLKFVEYKIRCKFKMENAKVGDLVVINNMICRITQLDYELEQTTIYANAEMQKYYYDSNELYLQTEAGIDITTENNVILEAEL